MGNIEKRIEILLNRHLGTSPSGPIITKLSGLTNLNFKVYYNSTFYFVRFGNPKGSLFGTSLKNDSTCAHLASKEGLAPKILFYDEIENAIISEYIETENRLVDLREKNIQESLLGAIRDLHSQKIKFPSSFCPFKTIKTYVKNCINYDVKLPDLLTQKILPNLSQLERRIAPRNESPCHLDLNRANILNDGKRLWIVDWEYAAMADPFFDLASTSASESFSDLEMEDFLKAYLVKNFLLEEEFEHLFHFRILADIRWASWCFLHAKLMPEREKVYLEYAQSFLQEGERRLHHLK